MYVIETDFYKGFTIKTHPEECAENPRTAWDNPFTIILGSHRDYTNGLGDEDAPQYLFKECGSWNEVADALWNEHDAAIVRAVRIYQHSGTAISLGTGYPFNCRWDSGQLGFIYVTKETIRREFSLQRISQKALKRAGEILESEFKVYADYVCGDVFWYSIEDKDGEFLESCGGFYGWEDARGYMLDQAKEYIDWHIKRQLAEHGEYVKEMIRNRVPLLSRKAGPLQQMHALV